MADGVETSTPRKLTYEQTRAELRLYWSSKSIPEQLGAMTALTKHLYKIRGIDLDEQKPNLTVRRVRRPKIDSASMQDMDDLPGDY